MASCCPSSGLHWPWLPAYLRPCSSHHRLVLPCSPRSCCPFGVFRSQLVLLWSSWCVRVVFLPSSFCPLVFLLSRCRAVSVAFGGRGGGRGRPRQQKFFAFGLWRGVRSRKLQEQQLELQRQQQEQMEADISRCLICCNRIPHPTSSCNCMQNNPFGSFWHGFIRASDSS